MAKPLRRPAGAEGLALLINGRVVVTVNDSETNTVLASAILDELWGFAIGRNTWSANGVALTPAAGVPDALHKVCTTCFEQVQSKERGRMHAPMRDAACQQAKRNAGDAWLTGPWYLSPHNRGMRIGAHRRRNCTPQLAAAR